MKLNRHKFICTLLLLCTCFFMKAQAIELKFQISYRAQGLDLTDSGASINDLKISTVKFYVSKIQFYKKNKLVFEDQQSAHLIDAAGKKTGSFLITRSARSSFDEVRFQFGIDSSANVSGALGGDLDPTRGMYWTWQSGYINMKLEGTSPLCETRNHAFQFHWEAILHLIDRFRLLACQ